jgi:Fic family protein
MKSYIIYIHDQVKLYKEHVIFKSPTPGSEEEKVIQAISQMHKALRYSLSTPSRWEGVLRRNAFARAIQGSNSIEGYVVTKDDAIAAAEGEEPIAAERETWSAVTGYRNAMTYVLQLSKDPEFEFNDGFLRSFHYMMLQHDLSKHPGNWRPGPIYVHDEAKGVNVYEGPPVELVPRLIAELISYLNSPRDSNHMLIKGAMGHLNLVMIHPFSDGNGRMARCLQTLVLCVKGIGDPTFSSIEEYLGRNTQDYYKVLAAVGQGKWNPQNDTRPWIRFNLTAHYRQAGTALRRARLISKLWGELEREIQTHHLPDRTIYALSDAAMGYRIRSSHYRHVADVSNVVASRDLRAVVNAGLLVAQGERRGRLYVATNYLRQIAITIENTEPKEIPDPFISGITMVG